MTKKKSNTQCKEETRRYRSQRNTKKVRSKTLDELTVREKVLVKHHRSGRWDTEATVTKQREDKLSYVIRDNNGQTFIRGRRLTKPVHNYHTSDRVLRSHKKPKEKEKNTVQSSKAVPAA